MECSCGYHFTDNDKLGMADETLKECPNCSTKFEYIVTEGSTAKLPCSMDFSVSSLFNQTEDVVEGLKGAVRDRFNSFGFNPDDFIVKIELQLKDKATEDKYIIDEYKTGEQEVHRAVKYEKG